MNFLKNLKEKVFGVSYDMTVSFLMKSGRIVDVQCDDIKIQNKANDLVGYQLTKNEPGSAFYIRLDDISAITWKKN